MLGGRKRFSGLAWLPMCLIIGVLPIPPDRATAAASTEYEVKAAFLLNFAKFVDWPPAAFAASDSPIAICILGKDPFGQSIDNVVQGEVVNGRRVVVKRIDQAPASQACQILFTQESGSDLTAILSGLTPGVLTVGEGDKFISDGGMIGFAIENRRVRFDINEKAAEVADLKLSSRLLSVARTVER